MSTPLFFSLNSRWFCFLFPLQIINHQRLRREVRRRILLTCFADRFTSSRVVDLVLLMQFLMLSGFLFVIQLSIQLAEIVMGVDVLRIDGERLLENLHRLFESRRSFFCPRFTANL